MMIHEITVLAGKSKKRKRVGRGEGSGHGKQSGRGSKGASSRSGHASKRSFEGGQMPYFRRMAKFGFTNAAFKQQFWIVNIADIITHPMFEKGGEVSIARLVEAGLVRDDSRPLKVLGEVGPDGLRVKLNIKTARISIKARQIVEGAGGTVEESGTRRDKNRGLDRLTGQLEPKNLTKKLTRGGKKKAKPAAEEPASEEAPKKK
jgi:large subunit ribosomal protein L15